MTRISIIMVLWYLTMHLPSNSYAQNRLGVGINVNQSVLDFGMGINLTTPELFKSFHLRLSGNILVLEGTPVGLESARFIPYGNVRLGIHSKPKVFADKVIVYREGGVVMLLNSHVITSRNINFGGYGVLGMEYHLRKNLWSFLEGGAIGTGAEADRIVGSPMYSTGLYFGTGFRWHALSKYAFK